MEFDILSETLKLNEERALGRVVRKPVNVNAGLNVN